MTNQHPVTPPPELVREWQREANHNEAMFPQVATLAAQWGADCELDACVKWLNSYMPGKTGDQLLRPFRRPKPPSLKEQALEVLGNVQKGWGLAEVDLDTIRRALEALPE